MFKPRLRITRRTGLLRPSPTSTSQSLPTSPFAVAAAAAAQQRSIHATHSIPPLNDGGNFAAEGVRGLYSPEGYNSAYTLYQGWCVEHLNRLTDGTGFEGISVKDLALMTSREPSHASVFNYASMAHNNHFFFDGLSVSGGEDPSEHMPEDLKVLLEDSFGSLETLQRELVLTADAMFGPGFVWLVRQAGGPHGAHRFPFKVLVTYLAGSPYPAAHWRRQGTDMNNQGGMSDKSGDIVREYFQMQKMSNNSRGTTGAGSSTTGGPSANNFQSVRDRNPGGTNLVPVLCVNTWEHAWLHDWRVGGKFNYLAAWWNVINWGKVAERASLLGGRQMTTTGNPLRAAEGGAWTGSG